MHPDDAEFSVVMKESNGTSPIATDRGKKSNSDLSGSRSASPSGASAQLVQRTSAMATIVNLINASLGSGLLSLPWATAGSSLLVGVGITFLVLLLNAGTIMILVVAAERSRCFDLGALMGKLPMSWSRLARSLVDAIIWFSVFACLVGYYLIAEDSFGPFLPQLGVPIWCGRPVSLLFSASVVLPLCFLDQSRLAICSSFCIAANIFLCGVVLAAWYSPKLVSEVEAHDIEPPCLLGLGRGAVTIISALMQAIILQMCVLPMYEELEARSPRRFAFCLTVSFLFVFFLFSSFSCAALLAFGSGVSSNVLNDLPPGVAGSAARLLIGLSVLGVYPIYLNCMVAPLRHTEKSAADHGKIVMLPSPASSMGGLSRTSSPSDMASPAASRTTSPMILFPSGDRADSPLLPGPPCLASEDQLPDKHLRSRLWRRWRAQRVKVLGWRARIPTNPSDFATVLIVVASAAIASRVHELGTVNIVSGAVQVTGLVGLAPGLIGMFLIGWHGILWKVAMVTLIFFSFCMTVVGLFNTDNFFKELRCEWFA